MRNIPSSPSLPSPASRRTAAPRPAVKRPVVQHATAQRTAVKRAAQPLYVGHRQRLRERFERVGADGLQNYELLELILFRDVQRRDVKPLAKNLLDRFGNLSAVLNAPAEQLREIDGMTETIIADFHLLQAVAEQIGQTRVTNRPVIDSWSALKKYWRTRMAEKQVEELHVLFLDNKHHLIEDKVMSRGTVNHTQIYPREVAKRALMLNAMAVVVVHNHPGGDPTPSRADIRMTNELKTMLSALNLVLHDHVIIGREGEASFKTLGLL